MDETMGAKSTPPLQGIKVLELATLLPGPMCGLILAELGAEVLKVEPPGGDPIRRYPPLVNGESALFAALNRGKGSIVLNLKEASDRERFLRIAEGADVVTDGWRPGVAAALGVDDAVLRARNPRLITCSITGYGPTGPKARRPGHDINYQAWAGIPGVTGTRDSGPVLPGVQIADIAGGALPAALSILAALIERGKTGMGRHLDVSLAEGALALMILLHARFAATGESPGPGEDFLAGSQPCYRIYKTLDGEVAVGALEPKFWEGFCRALGAEDLIPQAFGGPEIVERVRSVLGGRTTAEWMSRFDAVETCVEPVRPVNEVFADEAIARGGLMMAGPAGLSSLRALPASRAVASLGPAPRLGESDE